MNDQVSERTIDFTTADGVIQPAERHVASRLPILDARTAQDLMTPSPATVREDATVREALALFVDKRISGAPVVNAEGRPVGVISRADVVREALKLAEHPRLAAADFVLHADDSFESGYPLETVDHLPVRRVMVPLVCAVSPETSAMQVVREMLTREVHRLFVVRDGFLVGVISTTDVLKHLRA
jgi:CBS-domain-containing membrane protein